MANDRMVHLQHNRMYLTIYICAKDTPFTYSVHVCGPRSTGILLRPGGAPLSRPMLRRRLHVLMRILLAQCAPEVVEAVDVILLGVWVDLWVHEGARRDRDSSALFDEAPVRQLDVCVGVAMHRCCKIIRHHITYYLGRHRDLLVPIGCLR